MLPFDSSILLTYPLCFVCRQITDGKNEDWLRDRWQAAKDMTGKPIDGNQWVMLDLSKRAQITRLVLGTPLIVLVVGMPLIDIETLIVVSCATRFFAVILQTGRPLLQRATL